MEPGFGNRESEIETADVPHSGDVALVESGAFADSRFPIPDSRPQDIATYLRRHEAGDLLRFITCGSVDDGKSTLIGRLLHDTRGLYDDQLAALASDSRRHGTRNGAIDYALLVDGLAAEREQGITIDVAYRYFGTDKRRFIVADCPGHEQYTRNMATGASTAELAVVLVDARKGLLTQTRRHSYIVSLLGIRHVVLAVNKMDLVDYAQDVFDTIADEYRALATQLGITEVTCIPLSALEGDNLLAPSPRMPWYHGPSLLGQLEVVDVSRRGNDAGFRLPVQWVNRPHQDFRGFAGTVVAGAVRPGDEIVVLPSGRRSQVARIVTADGDLDAAGIGQAITLTLRDEIDVGRGDVIAAQASVPEVADQFAVHLLWLDGQSLQPGRDYELRTATASVVARITDVRHKIDINTQAQLAARSLELNEVAYCHLNLDRPIPFEAYADNRPLGAFVLVDRHSHATVACGTIDAALRRASNVQWQPVAIDRQARARSKGQTPRCLWFTGLSGAGKSTIADLVDQRLHALGQHTYVLDGDNLRHGLNQDLGFSDRDRVENIRRTAEVARLMVDAGLVVLVSFISPFRADRDLARARFAEGEFVEIHVDTPLATVERRDPKGLYARARAGQLRNFTGIDSPYEPPLAAELVLDTEGDSAAALAERVLAYLET